MTSRAERSANYLILTAFAVFALFPILTIVVSALGPDDSGAGTASASRRGPAPGQLRPGLADRPLRHLPAHQPDRVGRSSSRSAWCCRSWPGSPSAPCASAGPTALFYLFLLGHHDAQRGDRRPALLRPALRSASPTPSGRSPCRRSPSRWRSARSGCGPYFRSSSRADRRGGPARRRQQPADPVAGPGAAGPPRHRHPDRADLHVDVERVPHPAGHGRPTSRCAPRRSAWPSSRASTPRASPCWPPARSSSRCPSWRSTCSSSATSSPACSRAPSGSEGPATRVVTGTCGRLLDPQT